MKHNQYIKATLLLILAIVLIIPTNADPSALSLSDHPVLKRLQGALVVIESPMSTCGGFFVSPDLVLTNHEILEDITEIKDLLARSPKGTTYRFEGIYWVDYSRDLALLKVTDQKASQWISVDESASTKIGETAMTLNSYEGKSWFYTQGILSGYHADHFWGGTLVQTDAPAAYGCPGSPVINEKGQAIGVITTGLTTPNMNFGAIPVGVNKAIKSYTAKSPMIDNSYYRMSAKHFNNFTIYSKRILQYFEFQNKKAYQASFTPKSTWLRSGLDSFDSVSKTLSNNTLKIMEHSIARRGDSYISLFVLENKEQTESCKLLIHAKFDPIANRFVSVAVMSIDVMAQFKIKEWKF